LSTVEFLLAKVNELRERFSVLAVEAKDGRQLSGQVSTAGTTR